MATSEFNRAEASGSVTQEEEKLGEFEDLVGVPYAVIESDPGPHNQTFSGNGRIAYFSSHARYSRGLYFHFAETRHKPPGSRSVDAGLFGWLSVGTRASTQAIGP